MSAMLVAVGAAAGAMARHAIARTGIGWSATLIANLTGSLVLGVMVAVGPSRSWLLLVGTGFCGAFTTMSSLMLEAVEVKGSDRWRLIAAHLAGGLVFAAAGAAIGVRLSA